jgi:ABC-type multidrug transport system fused ATPase/permease subunit
MVSFFTLIACAKLSVPTAFVIAHRLSTIRQADQLLVIDGGRVIERGTHDSLLEQHGFYYNMYMSQYLLSENDDATG